MLEQAADKIAEQVDAQGPTGAKIAHHPGEVRNAGKHHAPVVECVLPVQRFAIHGKGDIAHHRQPEARGGDNDIRVDELTGAGAHSRLREAVEGIGNDRELAVASRLEQVGLGAECQTLLPGPVAGREMRFKLEVLDTGEQTHQFFQLLEHRIGFIDTAPGHHVLIEHDLRPHHPVNGRFVDTGLAKLVCEFIAIFGAIEIGRGTLQHGDVLR